MKVKLQKRLQAKEARKAELIEKAKTTEDIKELRTINAELDGLNGEIVELRGLIDEVQEAPAAAPAQEESRSAAPVGKTQVLAAYGVGQAQPDQRAAVADPYGTIEYRQAFMEFARTGRITPELRSGTGMEMRLDAMTSVSDVSAVIPSTILNEVVRKVTIYGQVFSRVRKLNIKGGVTVPILSLAPTATWIGENTPSEKKKIQTNTNVSFSYYGLECKVATSLLADTVTLTGFESTIIDLIVEAHVKSLDAAIISGNGSGKFLGITADDRVPAGQIVTIGSGDFVAWEGWKRSVFAKMPLAYKAGAVFLMASGTWEGYIDGMVDANGQPIGRVNYGITDGIQERFGGKEVIQVEDDILSPYDDADDGEVVAIYCNLRNYAVNSNMQMTMFRYFDHDTNEWVDKAILIADGKLIDPNGVVIIKKGA